MSSVDKTKRYKEAIDLPSVCKVCLVTALAVTNTDIQ